MILNDSPDGSLKLDQHFNDFPNWKVIHPTKKHVMFGKGSFHPKLWLLKFTSGVLRVVISSANLYMGDWSVWGNQLWFRDFQLKSEPTRKHVDYSESAAKFVFNKEGNTKHIKNDFQEYLTWVVKEMMKE